MLVQDQVHVVNSMTKGTAIGMGGGEDIEMICGFDEELEQQQQQQQQQQLQQQQQCEDWSKYTSDLLSPHGHHAHVRFPNTTTCTSVSIRDTLSFVKINVGGRIFTTRMRHFASYPQSRLGKLMRLSSEKKILSLCDAYHPGLPDPAMGVASEPVPMYFFDRCGANFDMVLDLYRHGTLHIRDAAACPMIIRRDLEYWGIDEYLFDPCCTFKFQQSTENCLKDFEEADREERKLMLEPDEDPFGNTKLDNVRRFLWNLTEYPENSFLGKCLAVITMAIIFVSTFTFLVTLVIEDPVIADEASDNNVDRVYQDILDVLNFIDYCAIGFFTLEYVVRLFSTPSLKHFFLSMLNTVDLLAILPFLISLMLYELQAFNIVGKAGKLLHLIRILRVFRVFKLVRHLPSLQSLFMTLRQANKELGLLAVMIGIALLIFATMTYYAERELSAWSFSESIWWVLFTLTTVGYDLRTPDTTLGQLTGCICSVVGVFVLTLPVPIVINSFTGYYKNRLIRRVVGIKHRKYMEERRKLKSYSIPNGLKMGHPRHDLGSLPFAPTRLKMSRSVPMGLAGDFPQPQPQPVKKATDQSPTLASDPIFSKNGTNV